MSAHERDWDAFVTLSPEGVAHMDLAVEGVTCAACMAETSLVAPSAGAPNCSG